MEVQFNVANADLEPEELIISANDLPGTSRVERLFWHQNGGGPSVVVNWQLDGNPLDVREMILECSKPEGLNVHLLPEKLTLSDPAHHRPAIIARISDGGSPNLKVSTEVELKDLVSINWMLDEEGQVVTGTPMVVEFDGGVSGIGGMSIAKDATVLLRGENSFGGSVIVDQGAMLTVTNNNGLGSLATGTEVRGTLIFDADDAQVSVNESINFIGETRQAAVLQTHGEQVLLQGAFTMRDLVGVEALGPVIFYGPVTTETGRKTDLVIKGTSALTFAGAGSNDFGLAGTVTIKNAEVKLGKSGPLVALNGRLVSVEGADARLTWISSNQIADSTKIGLVDGGTLDLRSAGENQNGWIVASAGSTGATNTIRIGDGGTLSLRTQGIEVLPEAGLLVTSDDTSGKLSAFEPDVVLHVHEEASLSITADMTAVPGGSFVVEGTGMMSMAGSGVFSAPIRSSSATISASNTSDLSQPPITIDGTARLSGVGRVGAVNATGTSEIDPGLGLIRGKLTCGPLSLASRLRIDVGNFLGDVTYDQLSVKGTVNLASPTLMVKQAIGYQPVLGTSFVIIENDGTDAVTGTFANLPEGATLEGGRFRITYRGGTGNDVVLFAAAQSTGLTRTWTGNSSTLWSNPKNWTPFGAPRNGDALVFPANATRRTSVNDMSNLALEKVTFSKGTFKLTDTTSYVVSGNSVALAGGIEVASGAPPVTWALSLALTGPQTFSTAAGTSLKFKAPTIDTNGMPLAFSVAGQSEILCFTPITEGAGAQFEKTGTGTLTLEAASTTRGELHIAAGEVIVSHGNGLGRPGDGVTTVDAGATLTIGGSNLTINEPINLAGVLRVANGAGSPVLGVGGKLTCAAGAELRVGNVGVTQLGLLSEIYGDNLRKTGVGRVLLAGTGTRQLKGGMTIEGGTVALNAGELPGTVTVGNGSASGELELNTAASTIPHTLTVNLGSAVRMNVAGITIGSLTLQDGAITGLPWKLDGRLTALASQFGSEIFADVELLSGTSVWSVADGPAAVDLKVNASVVEPMNTNSSLRKWGVGRVDFLGNNASTTVENNRPDNLSIIQGTAVWNGYTPTMQVSVTNGVTSGGTFGGNGNVGSVTGTFRGVIAPGTSPGQLRLASLELGYGSGTLALELNGTTAGTSYDQVICTGNGNKVDLSSGILTVTAGFNPPPGQVFKIIDVQGTGQAVPFFNLPDDSVFTSGGRNYQINYDGGDGNDVTLTYVPAATNVTRTWDGGGGANNNWSTAANWVGDTVPQPGDTLLFNDTAPPERRTMTADIPNMVVDAMTFSGTADYMLSGTSGLIVLREIRDTHNGADTLINVPLSLGASATFVVTGAGTRHLVLNGAINLRNHTLTARSETVGRRVEMSGSISGNGSVIINGSGEVRLSGTTGNIFYGGLTVQSGTAKLMKSGAAIAAYGDVAITGGVLSTAGGSNQIGGSVTVQGPGLFEPGVNDDILMLRLIGGAVNTGSSTLTLFGNLIAEASPVTATISGIIELRSGNQKWLVADGPAVVDLSIPATIIGAVTTLEIQGGGMVSLTGPRDYSGPTKVTQATLLTANTHTSGGNYTVAAGQTLQGTGSILSTIQLAGTLSPGTSLGSLTTGNLELQDGSTLALEINTSTLACDQLLPVNVDVMAGAHVNLALSDLGANVALPLGTKFTLVDYSGVWDDTDIVYFNNSPVPNGSTIALGANVFIVDYSDDSLGGTAMTLTVGTNGPLLVVENSTGQVLASGSATIDVGEVQMGGPMATATLTLRNTGMATLHGGAGRSGPDWNFFELVGDVYSIPPSGTHTLTVKLVPRAIGPVTATLIVNSNDAAHTPFLITLTGAVTQPEISVEQPLLNILGAAGSFIGRDLGTLLPGTSSVPMSFTIRNVGFHPLTGLAVTVDGANAADFAATAPLAASLAAGGTTTFTVTFTPSATGSRSAVLHIFSNDLDENPFDIQLSGLGASPEVAVDMPFNKPLTSGVSVFDFKRVGVGNSVEFEARIKNTGTSSLTLGTPALSGTNADAFIISASILPTTLAPSASTTFRVKFRPLVPVAHNVTLSIPTNDADENPFTFGLTGLGAVLNGPMTLSATTITEGLSAGTGVGLLSIADALPGMALRYSLVTGAGSTDNALFRIEDDELVAAVKLDAEEQPTRSVRIQARDADNVGIIAIFTITVNDVRTEDADGDGLTEAFEEDVLGTSDTDADFDDDGLSDGTELAFGSDPKRAPATSAFSINSNEAVPLPNEGAAEELPEIVTMSLSGSSVEFGAPGGTAVGTFSLSTGDLSGVTFSLTSGNGDNENDFFVIDGTTLRTAPSMLIFTGATASVRVRATKGIGQFEQVFTLTVQQKKPDTLVLPVPPPDDIPAFGVRLGASVATDGVRTVLGASSDDTRGYAVGVAKVFDNATMQLLHVLKHPTIADHTGFGYAVAIDGDWVVVGCESSASVFVFDLGSDTPEEPAYVLSSPFPDGNENFGNAVAVSGNRVVVGESQDDVGGIVAAGSAFVYDLAGATPTVPLHRLTKPVPAASDFFGNSVSIHGTQVIVGAPGDDAGATDSGALFKFDLSSATPLTPVAVMPNPNPNNGDMFGMNVSIASDGRVAAGCPYDDTFGTDKGIVFLFASDGTLAALVLNTAPSVLSYFGQSVSLSTTRLAVASGGSVLEPNDGSVVLYDATETLPTPLEVLVHPDIESNLNGGAPDFAHVVALGGDSLVVGTPKGDSGAQDAGGAWLYDVESTSAALIGELHHPSPTSDDGFGGGIASVNNNSGVAISGTRMVVAAPGNQRAYLYDFASELPDKPVLTLSSPVADAGGTYPNRYGRSVAIDGPLVVVGSEDVPTAGRRGVVYVYDLTSASPQIPAFTLPNPAAGYTNEYAASVAISGSRVVVGSMMSPLGGGAIGGRVFVYDLTSATPTVPVATLQSPAGMNEDLFGNDVAISGNRIAVGAYFDPPSSSPPPPGRVYIYDWSGPTPMLQHTIINPTPVSGPTEYFGENIALSGARLLVGARKEQSSSTTRGAAYLYDLDGASPTTPLLTLNNSSGDLTSTFGAAVAIDGTMAAVSDVVSQTSARLNRVHLYDLASATPTVPVKTLFNPQPSVAEANYNDGFGESVAIAGSLMAVGAEYSSVEAAHKGYVWVYGPKPANTAPVLTLNGANLLTYEARATYTDPGATATDAEDGTLTPVMTADTVVPNVPGTYAVTWSVTDSIGAGTTKTRTVRVIPNLPPTLHAPTGGFVPLALREGDALPNYAALAVANDNSGSVTVTQSIAPGTVLPPGTHTITLTATDGAGNQTTLSFTITVSSTPTTGIISDGFPLNPQSMWWHNEFTAHPTNGWLYGGCARGGQFGNGMIFRVNSVGDYETLVHFTNNGSRNKGKGPGGRLTLGTDGNFYGTTGEGGANAKGTIFKMTPAGELTTLVHFTGTTGAFIGTEPTGGVIQGLDGNFYGTTKTGGSSNYGTVFKITLAGEFNSLVSFTDLSGPNLGSFPNGALALDSNGDLYGTTVWGGANGKGTLFKVTTGGALTTLVNFTGTDGANRGEQPHGSLTLGNDGNFYGMTAAGGTNNVGTVFKMTSAGALTTLVDFTNNGGTNKGAYPYADLTPGNDGNFYGMTSDGGVDNKGTIFRVTPAGVLTTLVNFTGNGSTNKGAYPKGSLGLGPDGNFYSMTMEGGAQDKGTVFKVTPAGELTTLLESTTFYRGGTERGDSPRGALCPGPDGSLYGTTERGGNSDFGTIFKMDAFGNRTTLVHFTGVSGANRGARPQTGLMLASDGNLYGSTTEGGANDMGTLFRLTPAGVHTTLVDFTGNGATNKGAWCSTRLVQGADGHLYGMGNGGGAGDYGTIFRMTLAGELTTLIEFTRVGGSSPGAWPIGALTLGADGTFYGMTNSGGTNDKGTIFKFTTDGVMTVLVNFDLNGSGQNRGGWPWGGLAFGPDGALYGMTNYGGLNNFGTIFRMTTGGSITTLADFAGTTGTARGSYPVGTLITAPDGFIYGAANSGGTYGMGTLFKMTTGGAITMLVDFKGAGSGIESGGWPFMDDFTLGTDGQLYGMTTVGGRQGGGMVYRIEMPVPDIAVSGNGQNIANNDSTPSATDHTDFGQIPVASGSITRSLTIANTGGLDLILGTVSITGANAGDFTVSTAPAATVIVGGSTTLGITFDPTAAGSRTAEVRFSTNDSDETPFTFVITGTGNSPPTFAGMTIGAVQGVPMRTNDAQIISFASDIDDQTLNVTDLSALSAHGAILTRNGGAITYTAPPAFTGADTFSLTLSDGFATTPGTITVNVYADSGIRPAIALRLTNLAGQGTRLGMSGRPGLTYGVLRSTNLIQWTQIAIPMAGPDGKLQYEDPAPPQPSAFYRIIFPAEASP